MDVTHIKNMEEELAFKKKELEEVEYQCNIMRNFFDSAPVMMGLIHATVPSEDNPRFVHSFINPASAAQLGTTPQAIINNDVTRGKMLQNFNFSF
jgi:DUF438 domain-containing protein